MKSILPIVCLAVPGMVLAQTDNKSSVSSDNATSNITRIVRVRYGNPQALANMAASSTGVHYQWDNSLGAIVLKGPSTAVESVEQTIRDLDIPSSMVPSKDVEITVSVVGASNRTGLLPDGELPDSLSAVIKQLRAVFPYKNYQLLSSMLMRSREGTKAENQGLMQSFSNGTNSPYPSPYTLVYDEANVSSVDGKPTVHLRNFRFSDRTRVATGAPESGQYTTSDVGLLTDVDLREGQKVVVGKANLESSDSALFVILSARLVE